MSLNSAQEGRDAAEAHRNSMEGEDGQTGQDAATDTNRGEKKHNKPPFDLPKPSSYLKAIQAFFALNTFAGGLVLATQFIIQCPSSRLHALLAMASQLFLASLLSLMIIYLLLYNLDDQHRVGGQVRWLVVAQFYIFGAMTMAAFALLSAAIYVAGNSVIGGIGAGLVGVVLFTALWTGLFVARVHGVEWKRGYKTLQDYEEGLSSKDQEKLTLKGHRLKTLPLWICYALEVGSVICLLVFGGIQAATQVVQDQCTVDVVTNDATVNATRH